MVSPKVISSPKSAKPPKPGSSKSHLKDLVVGNEKAKSASKSVTIEKPKSGTTVEKTASNETNAALEEPKSTTALADPPTKPKKAKSTTAPANPLEQPTAVKSDCKLEQQQKVEKPTNHLRVTLGVLYGTGPTPSSNLESDSLQK